jgi:DNA-binding NtrC family response regulator
MNTSTKPKVLYLDDIQENLDSFLANFRRDFDVFVTNNPIDAYHIIDQNEIEIVVTDQRMPGMSGVEFLETVARDYPHVQRILLSGYSDFISAVEAVNKGKVYRIIAKPLNVNEIKDLLQEAWNSFKMAIEKDRMIAQLEKQNKQFEFMLRQKLLS